MNLSFFAGYLFGTVATWAWFALQHWQDQKAADHRRAQRAARKARQAQAKAAPEAPGLFSPDPGSA